MITIEERRKILEQVAAGQMNAQDAARVLKEATEASKQPAPPPLPEPPVAPEPPLPSEPPVAPEPPRILIEEADLAATKEADPAGKVPTWLHIRITDQATGKRKVNVNIPLRLLKVGWKIGRGFVPELQHIEWDDLIASLNQGQVGSLIDVEDDDDNTRVQIYVD